MGQDILKKISNIFEVGNFDQQNTLYILAEIRKFLEQANRSQIDKYKLTTFYSDWVLHAKLDRSAAKEMLEFLENGIRSSHGIAQKSFDIISFHGLRNELLEFIKKYDFKKEKFEQNWEQFLHSLMEIIADCPLENSNGSILKSFKILKPSKLNSIEYEANIDPANLPGLNHGRTKIIKLTGTLL